LGVIYQEGAFSVTASKQILGRAQNPLQWVQ